MVTMKVNPPQPARESYGLSHINRGGTYDSALANDPFDAYMATVEHELLGQLTDRLFRSAVPRYLDFACGTGRITSVLEGRALKSYGVDVSESMLAEARRKCRRTEFIRTDVMTSELPVALLDLVTAFRFFGNAEDELRLQALLSIGKALSGGGYLILNNHRNPLSIRNVLVRLSGGTVEQDLHYWKLRRMLNATGFDVVRTYGIGFWLVRAQFMNAGLRRSRHAPKLERLSRLRLLGPFCPDAIVVARKSDRTIT